MVVAISGTNQCKEIGKGGGGGGTLNNAMVLADKLSDESYNQRWR